MILGLLTFRSASGYDLLKLTHETAPALRVVVSKSQMYADLRLLEDSGYAAHRDLPSDKGPPRQEYTVTAAGRSALRAWIESGDLDDDDAVMAAMFFGAAASPESLIMRLEAVVQRYQKRHATSTAIEARLAGQPHLFHPHLVAEYGMEYERFVLRWFRRALKQLRERGG